MIYKDNLGWCSNEMGYGNTLLDHVIKTGLTIKK